MRIAAQQGRSFSISVMFMGADIVVKRDVRLAICLGFWAWAVWRARLYKSRWANAKAAPVYRSSPRQVLVKALLRKSFSGPIARHASRAGFAEIAILLTELNRPGIKERVAPNFRGSRPVLHGSMHRGAMRPRLHFGSTAPVHRAFGTVWASMTSLYEPSRKAAAPACSCAPVNRRTLLPRHGLSARDPCRAADTIILPASVDRATCAVGC